MQQRTLSNPEVSKLAGVLVQRLEVELRGMMLGNDDAALVLLAAAHGRARAANWTRDGLVNRAAAVWESCEEGREPMRTSLDFDVPKSPDATFSRLEPRQRKRNKMKARDFSNSNSPVALDPSGNRVVYPAPNGSATISKPVSHGGAQANPSPSYASTRRRAPSAPPPIGFDLAELVEAVEPVLAKLRAMNEPTEFDVLMSISRAVLDAEPVIALLASGPDVGNASELANRIVEFGAEIVSRARALTKIEPIAEITSGNPE